MNFAKKIINDTTDSYRMICPHLPYIEITLTYWSLPDFSAINRFLVVQKSLHGNVKKRLSTITV